MPAFSPMQVKRRLITLSQQITGTGAGVFDPSDLPSPDEQHNARIQNLEAPFTSLTFSLQSFFAVFAIQMGASNTVVGWLSSGPALLNLLWLIPCGRLIQRARNTGRPYALGTLLHRIIFISFFTLPFLPESWRPWAFVALVTLAALPNTLRGIAFQAASGEMFSPRHLARFIGQRWAIMSITEVACMLTLGVLLDLIPFPLSFQVLTAGTGLVALLTVWFVLQLRLPQRTSPRPAAPRPRLSRHLLREVWTNHRSFVLFQIGVLTFYLALYCALPLFRIYWVRDLEASGLWVGILLASLSIGLTVGSLFLGRWSRPDRDRRILLWCGLGYATAYPMLTALSGTLAPLMAVGLLAGFCAAGAELVLFHRMVKLSPAEERPTFIAIHNLVANAAVFVGPLLGTSLADAGPTRYALLFAGGLGILGALLLYLLAWDGQEADVEVKNVP